MIHVANIENSSCYFVPRESACKVVIVKAVSTMLKMLTSANTEDIPLNCFDKFSVEMNEKHNVNFLKLDGLVQGRKLFLASL